MQYWKASGLPCPFTIENIVYTLLARLTLTSKVSLSNWYTEVSLWDLYSLPSSWLLEWFMGAGMLMSILIRYSCIPFYFCFSIASSTLLIHHYAPQPHLFSLFHYFLYIVNPPLCTLTTHDCTQTHFIGLISLIWWTHVSRFTCFISILSIPDVCPPMVQPITNPRTMWSGTYLASLQMSLMLSFLLTIHI